MSTDNLVLLTGFVGDAPRISTFQDGGKLADFSMATSRKWKDRDGKEQEATHWHNIVVRVGFLADRVEEQIKKGTLVQVAGMLETRKYADKDTGKDRYITEVVVRPYHGSINIIQKFDSGRRGPPPAEEPRGAAKSNPAKTTTGEIIDDSVSF